MDLTRGGGAPGLPGAMPALILAGLAAAALGGAWAIQAAGYPPCELCLLQRHPYYLGVPLALLTAALWSGGAWRAAAWGYLLLAGLFVVSMGLGAYHAGVEWQLWAGPSGCTGAVAAPADVADFMRQLETVKVVRCDAPALLVLGLSLAAWNALLSAGLALLAFLGWRGAQASRRLMVSPARTRPPSTTPA